MKNSGEFLRNVTINAVASFTVGLIVILVLWALLWFGASLPWPATL